MSKRLDMFDTMIAKGSQDPFVHYARAMELRSLERLEDALGAYQEVMRAFPDYVPTYLMAGQVAEQLGHVDQARASLEAGIAAAQRTGDGHALSELRGLLATLD
jgi:tetratricopeptide (TPR) repeat protein